jgi:hypothetical protein
MSVFICDRAASILAYNHTHILFNDLMIYIITLLKVEVLTVMITNSNFFLVVMPYNLVEVYSILKECIVSIFRVEK